MLQQTSSRWQAITTVNVLDMRSARVAPRARAQGSGGEFSHAPLIESLETRLLLSDVPFVGKYVYTNSSGCTVTVSLTGGGSGVLHFPGYATNNADPSITVTPSGSKSSLSISVKASRGSCGGWAQITGLTVVGHGLKSINAPRVDLDGVLSMDCSNGATITLGDLGWDRSTTLSLSGTSSAVTTLKLGFVWDTTISASGIPLAITSEEWYHVSATASYFTKIGIKHYMGDSDYSSSRVYLTATSSNAKGVSIGSLTVGSELFGNITVPGRINSISVGAANSGTITAGSIGTITAKGYKGDDGKKYTGYWYPNVTVTGSDAKGVGIGSIKVAGSLRGNIQAGGGRINSISANGIYTGTSSGILTIKAGSIGTVSVVGHIGSHDYDSLVKFDIGNRNGFSIGSVKASDYIYGIFETTGRINSITSLNSSSVNGILIETDSTVGTVSTKGDLVAFFTVRGYDSKLVSIGKITVGRDLDADTFSVNGRVGTLTAGRVSSGTIHAGSIGTLKTTGYKVSGLTVNGHMQASIVLSGSGVGSGKNTLDKLTLSSGGRLTRSMTIHGNAGTISVGEMVGSIVVDIQGRVSLFKTTSELSGVPTSNARLQISGGGTVKAKNGTFKPGSSDRLYVM